jgi:hypothetical protein
MPALKAYAADHNGQPPRSPTDLMPYVSAPEQQAVLQKMERQIPAGHH